MNLTKRDKIVHLLNRFGLGASEHEVEVCLSKGVDATANALINFDPRAEADRISPFELVFEPDPKTVQMDAHRVSLLWAYRMVTTEAPGQEKLALFWHSHFAVSAVKVGFGPIMLNYLDILREGANGTFPALLEKVTKSAAMVHWLDSDKSIPTHPNENFAREVMELFTLGIGNYTEKDIQEAARAFTGYSIRYPYYEMGHMSEPERVRASMKVGAPMAAFQDAPDMHDNGPKTVLGETKNFSAEDILRKLALHPKTSDRLVKKLWEFYAYGDPEPAVVQRLSKAYQESGGNIQAVLFGIYKSPEFWSDKCVGTLVKSPVDFAVGGLRQVNAGLQFKTKRGVRPAMDKPLDRDLVGDLYHVWNFLRNQGLAILYPPDVSGWKWGKVWATPAAMLDRGRFYEYVFNSYQKGGPPSSFVLDGLIRDHASGTPEQIVDRIAQVLNVSLSPGRMALLTKVCEKNGGAKTLVDRRKAANMVRAVTRFVYASPEYQLC